MNKAHFALATLITSLALAGACNEGVAAPDAAALATAETTALDRDAMVERGLYLVTVGGCHDCHTPWKMGDNGPEPDMTRALSGHPAGLAVPEAPPRTELWTSSATATMTAWSGPWGTSFTANLTPDEETGLGSWDAETFKATIRNGRHMGRGRPILPPMPYFNYAKMTDQDLESVFAYLQTLPAISNRVPEPRPPQPAAIDPDQAAGVSRSSSTTSQ